MSVKGDQYSVFTKREQSKHILQTSLLAAISNPRQGHAGLCFRRLLFYLLLNVMDVMQLLVRVIAVDYVCFMDHIFVFQIFF